MIAAVIGACVLILLAPQSPPAQRDAPAGAASGAGIIRGHVRSSDDAHTPVRLARVVLTGVPGGRGTTTDETGAYVFANLPAGNYTVSAAKTAYIPSAYGSTRPGRAGTTIVLADKQTVDADITLALGGVVTGVIRDAAGRPMPGVDVGLMPAPTPSMTRVSFPSQPAATDDRGVYRLYGVPPGRYLVAAVAANSFTAGSTGARSVEENDALIAELQARTAGGAVALPPPSPKTPALADGPAAGFAPRYFPGTSRSDEATVITVTLGEEKDGIDFVMSPVRSATVAGTVQGPVGDLRRVELTLIQDGPKFPSFTSSRPVLVQAPDAQGKFRYLNMPPGHYTVVARAVAGGAEPAVAPRAGDNTSFSSTGGGSSQPANAPEGKDYCYARAEFDVDGAAVDGVSLVLTPGATASGRVVFDRAAATVPDDLSKVVFRLATVLPTDMSSTGSTVMGNAFASPPAPPVRADGTWHVRGVPPGRYTLSSFFPASMRNDWRLASAALGGRELLDGPFDVAAGQDFGEIVFTLTDRHNELRGLLQSASGEPAAGYFVVVFPSDSRLWTPDSRRVKTLRPGSDGAFSIKDLPAGDYLLAALTDVAPGDPNDPQWLASVAPGALPIAITDGGVITQTLKIR